MGEMVSISEQATDSRLSPAEAHDVIRQRLERLARRWNLTPADVHRLVREMNTSTYAPGEMILPQGVRADCLGLVIQGQVAIHVGKRAATRLVVVLLPGSTFGEMMLAAGRPSNAAYQALTRCEIRFLRRADLQAVRQERRLERQTATLSRLVRAGAILLIAILGLLLLLRLPPARQTLALAPMTVGQWCNQRRYGTCTRLAWRLAADLSVDDPNPLLALGTFYFGQGDLAAAEEAFEAAGSLGPDLPEVHNNLGLIYAEQGEHEPAIDQFRRALELEPGIAATEHNLAQSLQVTGQYDEALKHYQAALALAEPQTSTLVNVAIVYYELGRPEEAAEAARQALAHDPSLAAAHTVLGAVDLESRQPERALSRLQQAIALDASYGQAHFYLGLAYKSLGRPAEAVVAFEQALAHAQDEIMRVRIRRHLDELYEVQEHSRTQ
jgi:tetratricopeptide (TPR) repeat protein